MVNILSQNPYDHLPIAGQSVEYPVHDQVPHESTDPAAFDRAEASEEEKRSDYELAASIVLDGTEVVTYRQTFLDNQALESLS